MKLKKVSKRLAAAMLTGAMMVSMLGMTAFAEETEKGQTIGTGATGALINGKVQFAKVLDMTEASGASVPNVTFTYNIKGGSHVDATATTPEILKGIGSPTIGAAVYRSVDDETTTDVDETDLTKYVTVDFSTVEFNEPGIYRYVITEEAATPNNADITNATPAVRYLDVYVVNGDTKGTYKIESQALIMSIDEKPVITKDSTTGEWTAISYDNSNKSNGYTNYYKTYSLTLSKNVTGTMANLSEKFDFTVEFTNGPANGSFTYQLNGGQAITVQLDENGAGKIEGIKLNNTSGNAVITGIPSTVSYTIKENIDAKEGYKTTYSVNNENPANGTEVSVTAIGKDDDTVAFTNTKNAVTPTGVALTIAPYILMVGLAGVLAFFFLRRRKSEF